MHKNSFCFLPQINPPVYRKIRRVFTTTLIHICFTDYFSSILQPVSGRNVFVSKPIKKLVKSISHLYRVRNNVDNPVGNLLTSCEETVNSMFVNCG